MTRPPFSHLRLAQPPLKSGPGNGAEPSRAGILQPSVSSEPLTRGRSASNINLGWGGDVAVNIVAPVFLTEISKRKGMQTALWEEGEAERGVGMAGLA